MLLYLNRVESMGIKWPQISPLPKVVLRCIEPDWRASEGTEHVTEALFGNCNMLTTIEMAGSHWTSKKGMCSFAAWGEDKVQKLLKRWACSKDGPVLVT